MTETTQAKLARVITCEVYSRVCGYFRPVSGWNAGKLAEFMDRVDTKIPSNINGPVKKP